jgi:hypothetical protein
VLVRYIDPELMKAPVKGSPAIGYILIDVPDLVKAAERLGVPEVHVHDEEVVIHVLIGPDELLLTHQAGLASRQSCFSPA